MDVASPSFGTRPRARRPILLLLVLGVLLAVVGVTATAQAVMVSVYASSSTLNAIVSSDVATLRGFLSAGIDPSIATGELTDDEAGRLSDLIATLTAKGELVRVELRRVDGSVIVGSEPGLAGLPVSVGPDFAAVVESNAPAVSVLPADEAEAAGGPLAAEMILREYLPLASQGEVVLVAALWRDAEPLLGSLDDLRRDVVLVTLSAAVVAAIVLLVVFRSAQGRISRQTEALVEASLRDPLTGTLNHGALVAHLATEIERARAEDTALGVALVDVDNFRLLNDNHGHRAGDDVLLAVAEELAATLPSDAVMGRYGPDEFLIVAPPSSLAELEPTVERLRILLVDLSLQFDSTERLPVTVSAGLCTYPEHGASVTVLLATAAQTLEEAKASGGDRIKVADRSAEDGAANTSSFDVLQGLVFAVDTKDRYTKRHSEDVARYAVFLGERLGLEPDLIRSLHLAGLLHDVGKIGVPDRILRKPGRLTADEYDVVKQHVALGDMIVRELPDIETVRAGIRHHHERWDGRGYLSGLSGEAIPLVARILAVGDAFSAMTTTRPYRKALGVREALLRLGDAAGTQLDETLVAAFVTGIETAEDPPLPGIESRRPQLWTPGRIVA